MGRIKVNKPHRRTWEDRVLNRQARSLVANGARATSDENFAIAFKGKTPVEVGEELLAKMTKSLTPKKKPPREISGSDAAKAKRPGARQK
jgi:hypothetical protein